MKGYKFLLMMLITACVFSVAAQAAPIIKKDVVITHNIDSQAAVIAPQFTAVSDHYLFTPAHERWYEIAPAADVQSPGITPTTLFIPHDIPISNRIRAGYEGTTFNFTTLKIIDDGGRCSRENSKSFS